MGKGTGEDLIEDEYHRPSTFYRTDLGVLRYREGVRRGRERNKTTYDIKIESQEKNREDIC